MKLKKIIQQKIILLLKNKTKEEPTDTKEEKEEKEEKSF